MWQSKYKPPKYCYTLQQALNNLDVQEFPKLALINLGNSKTILVDFKSAFRFQSRLDGEILTWADLIFKYPDAYIYYIST